MFLFFSAKTLIFSSRISHDCVTKEIAEVNFSEQNRARPGFEPGTSRTLSANHTPRPTSHCHNAQPYVTLNNNYSNNNINRQFKSLQWIRTFC